MWKLSSFRKGTKNNLGKLWGVYVITCLATGKIYVGSASGINGLRGRMNTHLLRLERGDHHSPYLQRAFSKYGAEQFEVRMLVVCPPEQALQIEQRVIDCLRPHLPENGYNATDQVGYRPPSEGMKAAMRRAPKGVGKSFRLMFQGEVFEGRNLVAFCRRRNLNASKLCQVLRGKSKQWKGWTLPETPKTSYTFRSPSGEILTTTHLTNFAAEFDLSRQSLNRLALGQRETYRGWTLTHSP